MENRSVNRNILPKSAIGSGMKVSHAGTLGSKSRWPLGLLLMRDAPRQRVASCMDAGDFWLRQKLDSETNQRPNGEPDLLDSFEKKIGMRR